MDAVLALAGKHGLWVVEDAACALGGWYRDRHAGTFGELGCFSFHPRKSVTTGEGGMLTTQRDDLAELARTLRDHGASRSDLARHEGHSSYLLADYDVLGFNYRLTDIQGALGSVQMDRLKAILAERRRLAARYDEALADVPWLRTPSAPHELVHGYQAYVCLYAPEQLDLDGVEELHRRRNDLMARLDEAGIATRPGTHAAALTGYYAERYGIRPQDVPDAYRAERLSLALPLYPGLTDEEQDRVVEQLRRG
jgi:perosamine synthetase